MTQNLITVHLEDSVQKAYEILRDRNIRHLPVKDDAGSIIGILSDRDFQRAMKPKKLTLNAFSDEEISFNPHFKVKDFMSWPINTVDQSIDISNAARQMVTQKISALLVLDERKIPRGIITTEDMMRLLIEILEKDPSGKKVSFNDIPPDWKLSNKHWT